MGLLAARAQPASAEGAAGADDAARPEARVKAMLLAARSDPPVYDQLQSGACMGAPMSEQGGKVRRDHRC